MKSKNAVLGDPLRGFTYLMAPGKESLWKHESECHDYIRFMTSHPFGLAVPEPKGMHPRREFVFTGGGYSERDDMVTVSFLAHIRYWAGSGDRQMLEGLRVITVPFHDGRPEHHHVFFEASIWNTSYISGETTDFPEGTRRSMLCLEDVFAFLSHLYKVEIERVTAPAVPLEELYEEKNFA